ncbi:MAG: cell wall-binding repeat-containing protein [Actinomycetota bacterium]|nr:cell wall-binding repeat-containing protein [Actinomycetota bacterium]MDA8267129.1 cell wall-binding repeat-containing protein [Actinomycetota bacterium]
MREHPSGARRWAVGGLAATLALTGASVLGLSGVAAAAPATGSSVSATSSPTIRPTGTNQAAGNLVVTLTPGSTCTTGDTITLSVTDSKGGATVDFTNNPTVTPSDTAGTVPPTVTTVAGAGTGTITTTITCGAGATSYANGETFTFSNVAYNTTGAAAGGVNVVATYGGTTLTPTTGASNATVTTNVPSFATYATASSPTIGAGVSGGQAAANLQVQLATQNTSWQSGDTLSITVADGSNSNCTSKDDTVAFSAAPKVTASVTAGQASPTPTFSTPTLVATGVCAGQSVDNTVVLTFTNSGSIIGTNPLGSNLPPVMIDLSGVSYTVGSAAQAGQVYVGTAYTSAGNTTTTTASNTQYVSGPPFTGGPSNAFISDVLVNANNPSVGLVPGAPDAKISPIAIVETKAGVISAGYVCVALDAGTFDASSTPTVTESGGGAAVGSTVVGMGSNQLSFKVTTASSSGPATYTLSGLQVDAPTAPELVGAFVKTGSSAGCGGGSVIATSPRVFSVIVAFRTAGSTEDATAAQALLQAYPVGAGCTENLAPGGLLGGQARAVVLATNRSYQDALSASYLAGQLGTGVLLTSPDSLSASATSAIRIEGITEVYVIGGPEAISSTVINQVKALTAYDCGGNTPVTSLVGTPENVQVVGPIYGQTADGTAQAVAEYFSTAGVNSMTVPGAYGMYNDTTGNSSSAPSTTEPLRTAILATDAGFQDAASASAIAYKGYPLLLTPTASLGSQAQQAIVNLGIQQVIVMGGPLAISDNVVTQLQALGVSVLRIAGQDLGDTSQMTAQFEQNSQNLAGAPDGLGWGVKGGANSVLVARGDYFSDAITGSAVAGVYREPILLTLNPNSVSPSVITFLNNAGSNAAQYPVIALNILGGPLAITQTTVNTLFAALANG